LQKVEDYWNVFFDRQKEIKKRFDATDIAIPFPQRDIPIYRTE
jgi:small conductance mechanosensitive channel